MNVLRLTIKINYTLKYKQKIVQCRSTALKSIWSDVKVDKKPCNWRTWFKVSNIVNQLGQLDSSKYHDSVRLLIPRASTFVYDITSNRGARHDPYEIDPNKMDASVVVPVVSWILSDLIRIADAGSSSPEVTISLVEELLEKKFPHLENVDGRIYINVADLSAPDVGLLLLNAVYPKRIRRGELVEQIRRHGHKKNAAIVAVSRLQRYVDDDNGDWKIRGIGRAKAAEIQSEIGRKGRG